MVKSICVFSASSSKVEKCYLEAATQLANVCCDNHIHVIYGGGASGLMGTLANQMLIRKGRIKGIIPRFMVDLHWNHDEVEDMIVTDDMRERKRRMTENVDAVVALPGGVGTLEELVEVITLKQLGRFLKPIIIVNTNGFYNPLLSFFDAMITQHFMREQHRQLWEVIEHPDQLFKAIDQAYQRVVADPKL
jgi:uncharacterized protein (TIGR00730 family)